MENDFLARDGGQDNIILIIRVKSFVFRRTKRCAGGINGALTGKFTLIKIVLITHRDASRYSNSSVVACEIIIK